MSYDDKKRRVYVDGTALTRILSEKSSEVLSWSMNDGLNVLRLNTKRKELMMDGESMKMELTFVDSENLMNLVPFDIRRCELIEKKILFK